MSGEWFERLLDVDPRDAGCEEAMLFIMSMWSRSRPEPDAAEYSLGLAPHRAARGSCAEDARGLLAVMQHDDAHIWGAGYHDSLWRTATEDLMAVMHVLDARCAAFRIALLGKTSRPDVAKWW